MKYASMSLLAITASILLCLQIVAGASTPADNTCTFHIGGKLFSLLYLDKQKHYKYEVNQNQVVYINFCTPFVPTQCPDEKTAYSFLVSKHSYEVVNQFNQTIEQQVYNCTRYSSNSRTYLFTARYEKQGNLGTLEYKLETEAAANNSVKKYTRFQIQCSDDQNLMVKDYKLTQSGIQFIASSRYGCPVFQVSSIWKVFQDNWIIIGLLLVFLGFHLLFFGRTTIETTIFIAGFLIIFAVLASILSIFITPYSSTFVIYFSFLLLLFSSTLLAYGITKLVGLSIFFVGAIFGFITGMLVNSIFCSIFNIYSVWSLVVFQILFTIPFGLLSFHHTDQIIIASSALTGSYLIIRPISWIFGGFPNEFLLYQMVQTRQLNGLPWTFFLYLIFIIALAIVGAMYQLIKFQRQNVGQQIQVNFIQQTIQQPIDMIKQKVDKLIERFKSDKENEDYRKMREMQDAEAPKRKTDQTKQKQDVF